jgi:hypothetical protein
MVTSNLMLGVLIVLAHFFSHDSIMIQVLPSELLLDLVDVILQ